VTPPTQSSDGPSGATHRLRAVLEAVDAANEGDPSRVTYEGESLPLALAEGRAATAWVRQLRESEPTGAPEPLLIAARGHHMRRWETPRASYPAGREGYLAWRSHLYDVHAGHLEALMREAGYADEDVAAMRRMVRKQGIKTHADVQTYEDAVALAFLELQFAPFAARTAHEPMVRALRRTWRKMSEAGRAAALTIPYNPSLLPLLTEATTQPADAAATRERG
jgi:hypothetical protein